MYTMYKLKNKRTNHVTVVHILTSLATKKKAVAKAIYDHKDELKKYNTVNNWKVINYSTSGHFDYPDDEI